MELYHIAVSLYDYFLLFSPDGSAVGITGLHYQGVASVVGNIPQDFVCTYIHQHFQWLHVTCIYVYVDHLGLHKYEIACISLGSAQVMKCGRVLFSYLTLLVPTLDE
jgi:hypothetical protein